MGTPRTRKVSPSHWRVLIGDGKFALGITVGFLSFCLLYVGFSFFDQSPTRQEVVELLPTVLTLLVATVSVFIAYYALTEQRKSRQAGTDPVILVHLGKREDARILSTLEITNVGAGAARDVMVTLKSDISEFVPQRIITDFAKLKYPIRTIPQDFSVSYNFGLGHELLANPPIPKIEFSVEYFDIDGVKYESIQFVDVRELTAQRADEGLMSRLVQASEKLAKAAEDAQSDHKPFRCITQTKSEYQRERAEWISAVRASEEK
ncbi:hypothetical protein [Actibacterium sp. D379-3]